MKIKWQLLTAWLFFVILISGCANHIHDVFLGESITEVQSQDVRYSVYSDKNTLVKKTVYLLLPSAGYSSEEYLRKWIALLGRRDSILIAPNLDGIKIQPKELCIRIREFVLAEVERSKIAQDHIMMIGESNGAILGFEFIDHFPDLFRASVMISGAIDQRILEELVSNAKAVKTEILVVHGTDDLVFKLDSMKKNYELLTNAGVVAELRVVPGMGHGSDIFTDEEVVGWLKTKNIQ